MHHFVVFLPNYKQRGVEEDSEMVNENEGQLSRGTPKSFYNPPSFNEITTSVIAPETGCSCTNLDFNGSFLEISSFFSWLLRNHHLAVTIVAIL